MLTSWGTTARVAVTIGAAVVLAAARAPGSEGRAAPATSPRFHAAQAASDAALAVPGRSNATPWIAASGAFVAVVWGASADGRTDVFLAVSRNGGARFGEPVRVNREPGEGRLGGELPPRVALSPVAGKADPAVTVLWNARAASTTIKMSRSLDGGRTFEPPAALQQEGAPGDRGWPALAVDDRGAAHAIWLDHRGLAPPPGAPKPVHKPGAAHDGVAMAQKSGLYYAGGPARGERALTNGVCYCCKTALAAGPGGALYAAWRHVYPGDLRDIAFSVSRDGGRSFSPAARISEDGWAIHGCPDDGPALAVGSDGVVHAVWPTVLAGAEPRGALFYASSRDGRSFTPRVEVPTLGSPKPAHPQIAIGPNGRVVVAWDEAVGGRKVATVREVRRHGTSVSFGEPVMLASAGNAHYPVVAAAGDGFVTAWATGGDASVVQTRVLQLP